MLLYSIFKRNDFIQMILVMIMITLLMIGYDITLFNTNLLTSFWKVPLTLSFLFITLILMRYIDQVHRFVAHRSYVIFFYGTLLFFFPRTLQHLNLVIANLLIVIALLRILSISNSFSVKQKILDSSLLILLASLFYTWSILLLLLIVMAVIIFTPKSPKHLLIPVVATLPFVAVLSTLHLFYPNVFSFSELWKFSFTIHQEKYHSWQYLIPSIVITLTGGLSIIHFLYYQKKHNYHKSSQLLIGTLVICVCIVFLSRAYNGAEHIFLFAPLSILISILCEHIKKRTLKEVLLLIFALVPLGILLMLLITKS